MLNEITLAGIVLLCLAYGKRELSLVVGAVLVVIGLLGLRF